MNPPDSYWWDLSIEVLGPIVLALLTALWLFARALARALVTRAANRVAPKMKDRLAEEWTNEVESETRIFALTFGFHVWLKARTIRAATDVKVRAETPADMTTVGPNRSPDRRVEYERFFLDNLGLIDQVVRFVARRHRLSQVDLEDFRSLVHLKLLEHDYDVLRKFEHRTSLATFLTTVITRIFLDERIVRWGRWRPSAAARRLGPVAILLEQLISRDGLSFDAAVETLRTNHHVELTDAEFETLRLETLRRCQQE